MRAAASASSGIGDCRCAGFRASVRDHPLAIVRQPRRIAVHDQRSHAAPRQRENMHTLIVAGPAIRQREVITPRDHGDGVPRPASDGDAVDLKRRSGNSLCSRAYHWVVDAMQLRSPASACSPYMMWRCCAANCGTMRS